MMQDEVPQINIELEDLQELARINPLAWEQLLHIADSRILNARIVALENATAQGELSDMFTKRFTNG